MSEEASAEISEIPPAPSEAEMVQILTAELTRLQSVASDRLVWLRVLEKAVNDVDTVIKNLKSDVAEISKQVAIRNANQEAPLQEESSEESEEEE